MTRILAIDDHSPLCTSCGTALGGRLMASPVYFQARLCAHCGRIGSCTAAQDWTFPWDTIRPPRQETAPEAPRTAAAVFGPQGSLPTQDARQRLPGAAGDGFQPPTPASEPGE
jgi:hypothetical protein